MIQILAFAHVLGCSYDFIFDYLTYGFCFVCKLNTIALTLTLAWAELSNERTIVPALRERTKTRIYHLATIKIIVCG